MSTIEEAVSKGNITRTVFNPEAQIPLYLGSGSCGALFDCYGLIGQDKHHIYNDSGTFKHSDYFARGKYGIDYWLSAFTVTFADGKSPVPTDYSQSLDIFKGRLETAFTADGHRLQSRVYFNPEHRDYLTFELDGAWQLAVKPVMKPQGSYNEEFEIGAVGRPDGMILTSNMGEFMVSVQLIHLSGDLPKVTRDGADFYISLQDSTKAMLVICASHRPRFVKASIQFTYISGIEWRDQCEAAWRRRWGDSYVNLSDDRRQADWARSLYYVLCSFSPDGIPSAPMGWTGIGWRFHFPQDISYIHPALLRLGHYDLAKRIVEFYHGRIDDLLAVTRRIYGGKGIMWPWEFPSGTGTGLLDCEPPNVYQFEIHNAAYPARMAYETARHLHDDEWTQKYAIPIIRHSADFYASHLVKEANGKYSLDVKPSMSQDEFAEPNSRNYLCSLYSARYVFRIAALMGLHDYDEYNAAGLAFDRLVDAAHGIYRTSEMMREENYGKEKHPVQLNPLVFLPAPQLDKYEMNAYGQRFDICAAAKDRIYHGWTLAVFFLASSHLGKAEEMAREMALADDKDYRDPELLEFYETSGRPESMYYVTTHGLYLQAVQDAFVCDLFGDDRLEYAVPPSWKGSEYVNLHTANNVYSGIIN